MLVEYLKTEQIYYRSRVARALGKAGPKAREAVPILEKLHDDEDMNVRVWSAFALARITGDSKPQIARLVEMWKDSKESGKGNVRAVVVEALVGLTGDAPSARDILLEIAATHPGLVIDAMSRARNLDQLRDKTNVIVPRLVALLTVSTTGDTPWRDRRIEGVTALGMLGPLAKAAIPDLRKLLDDDNDYVAAAAAKALDKVEGR